MRVALIFVYLCFLLLRGNTCVYADTGHAGTPKMLAQHVDKKEHFSSIDPSQDSPVIKNIDSGIEAEYLISDDDVEEEDANDFSAPKYRLPVRNHPIHDYPSYPSILNYLCNCFKVTPSFFGQISDKYILQGVLRI
jgi:hypothetical protein